MKLKTLENITLFKWDKIISPFESKGLFHRLAWLEFISETQGGERVMLETKEGDKTIGYFTGFILKKGPFRILGSPLIGWTTEFMGPIVNKDFNQAEFLAALDKYCKSQKIDHLELSNPILEPKIMESQGFKCQKGATYLVNLSTDEKIMWQSLKKKSCRYSIHKAQKNNLIVEETDNPEITKEYYNQLMKVFSKQQLVPTYSLTRVQSLFNSLKKEGLLLALQVKYKNKVIATGFFPHDDKCLYFWGGASFSEFHPLCPNELLHWTAMILAAKQGIPKYNMGGRGSFKAKFGGELIPIYHWYKSYNPLAKIGRSFYQYQFRIFQKVKGFIKNYPKIREIR